MNREQMVEKAADVVGPKLRKWHEDQTVAAAVLDAILPQVTTVEELATLPSMTLLVSGAGSPHRAMQLMQIVNSGMPLMGFPYTVVWSPPEVQNIPRRSKGEVHLNFGSDT